MCSVHATTRRRRMVAVGQVPRRGRPSVTIYEDMCAASRSPLVAITSRIWARRHLVANAGGDTDTSAPWRQLMVRGTVSLRTSRWVGLPDPSGSAPSRPPCRLLTGLRGASEFRRVRPVESSGPCPPSPAARPRLTGLRRLHRLLAPALPADRALRPIHGRHHRGDGSSPAGRSEVMANLEHLVTHRPPSRDPRRCRRTNWTETVLQYGLTARLEAWQFGVTWQRGRLPTDSAPRLSGASSVQLGLDRANQRQDDERSVGIDASTAEHCGLCDPGAGAWPCCGLPRRSGERPAHGDADSVAMRRPPPVPPAWTPLGSAESQTAVRRRGRTFCGSGCRGILTDGSKNTRS
jgi:hypothetical protein